MDPGFEDRTAVAAGASGGPGRAGAEATVVAGGFVRSAP